MDHLWTISRQFSKCMTTLPTICTCSCGSILCPLLKHSTIFFCQLVAHRRSKEIFHQFIFKKKLFKAHPVT